MHFKPHYLTIPIHTTSRALYTVYNTSVRIENADQYYGCIIYFFLYSWDRSASWSSGQGL